MSDKKSAFAFIKEYALKYLLHKMKQGVLVKMARFFALAAVACLAGPTFLQVILGALDLYLRGENISLASAYQVAGDFTWMQPIAFFTMIAISVVFVYFADRASRGVTSSLVSLKSIYEGPKFGNSAVNCYLGDISHITEAQVIVTSEDTSLDLGSISGTSVSGRVRRLAAEVNECGEVKIDHLQNYVLDWKERVGKYNNFDLGHIVFVNKPFCADCCSIQAITLAVAIRKRPQGGIDFDDGAIRKIILGSIQNALASGYESIFFPVFGLGSGGIPPERAVTATVKSVCDILRAEKGRITVYLGVYREDDLAELVATLHSQAA